MNKKFIQIITGYNNMSKVFNEKEDYFRLPTELMMKEGYECEIFFINSHCKYEDDKNCIKGVTAIYYSNIFQYIFYLIKNRKFIIYSNSLTIKTLVVGLIVFNGKTVFIPHSMIFGTNKLKSIIIHFFYRFFTKIRLNNNKEVEAVNKIKTDLGVKIPLVVSTDFYEENFEFLTENILVLLGNLISVKHPEKILQALKIVKERGYNFKLKVAGEDRLNYGGKSFKDLVKYYGLEQFVEFLGFVPHEKLKHILKGASCYLNASSQEGLCLAVYECTLMGMMTILPNIISFDGIFGDNGLYYESGNIEDFANKITYFLDHRDEFIPKIKENQQKILKEYNYDTIKSQLKDLFLSL